MGAREVSDKERIDNLIRSMGSRDEEIQNWATARIVGMSNSLVVPKAIIALGDKNGNVRKNAARILINKGDYRAVKPLIKALSEEKSSEVKIWMCAALGNIGDPEAVEPLLGVAMGENGGESVKKAAWKAIDDIKTEQYSPDMIRQIDDKVSENRIRKIRGLLHNRQVDDKVFEQEAKSLLRRIKKAREDLREGAHKKRQVTGRRRHRH